MDEPGDSDDDFLRAVARTPEVAPRPAPVPDTLTRLAQFRIEGKLGRGGMGIVYRAEDEKLRRVVALKVLPDDFAEDEQKRKRFFREARVAGSINHPNVATVYEVGEAEGRIYIAMELAPGVTLRKLLAERQLDEAEALHIACEISRGVSRAHARGIAHRDLKPDNVMVEGASVKVLDFGLAKPVEISNDREESVTWTQEGRIVGTPGYMSPEQATGRPVDVRTDVFALGVILYEMLSGQRPFVGDTSMEVVIATSRDRPRSLRELVPSLSRELDALVMRCLEKEPAQRFASAEELLAALETADRTTGEAVAADATPADRPRSRRWLGLGAIALAGLAAWKLAAPSPQLVTPAAPPSPSLAPEPATPTAPPTATPTATATATPTESASALVPPPSPSARAAPAVHASARPSAIAPASAAAPAPSASSPPRSGVIETSPY